MKVLIASDSFKGSLSSLEVGQAITGGIKNVIPEAAVRIIPIADGGEGTVEAMVIACEGEYLTYTVTGPLGDPVQAKIGIIQGGIAVMEMAAASGLPLVPKEKRNPLITTTRGTGELIKYALALDRGIRRILIGIGGSATNDGGTGMARALGIRFLDQNERELPEGGGSLLSLHRIDFSGADQRIRDLEITVMCDVDNPLCGPRGASAVYGPQKGATPEMVVHLDSCLGHLAEVIKRQNGTEIKDVPGAGAAGGLGGGLMAFTGAVLKSGTEAILETIEFDRMAEEADLIITGEGRMDAQSAFGKVPMGVASRGQKQGKPVIAIVGSVGEGAEDLYQYGLNAIIPIVNRPMSLDEAMAEGRELTVRAAEMAIRLMAAGAKMRSL
ncbi:glycerate kinase [Syntrophobotulus glycolicus DSM 8271]|uniref:Glycerate kinase n=1 Tax=Syntrophobotulus glycolicus (strain DSM 8271 / FlGlyR) TaxID=645991 RepID=F0T0Y6_SYNGF|nr:glycerate kinase [Syntrophobotulus glycolicus]ADY57357.1 glycerate kinase [Syntrophobotulus glycolicus DSM 8271]